MVEKTVKIVAIVLLVLTLLLLIGIGIIGAKFNGLDICSNNSYEDYITWELEEMSELPNGQSIYALKENDFYGVVIDNKIVTVQVLDSDIDYEDFYLPILTKYITKTEYTELGQWIYKDKFTITESRYELRIPENAVLDITELNPKHEGKFYETNEK